MNILILDDEQLARRELEYLISNSKVVKNINVDIFQAEDIGDALKIMLKYKIDILFLDISLNEENGFEVTDEFKQLSYSPFIVFATAYDQYAVNAFNVNAVDYCLKPFEQSRIDKSLTKVLQLMDFEMKGKKENNDNFGMLTVELSDRDIVLKEKDIVSATVSDGVLSIYTQSEEYRTKKTLLWLKKKLTGSEFLQVHRNSLVNIQAIKEIQPWFNHTLLLIMENGEKVQVGRSYQKQLVRALNI